MGKINNKCAMFNSYWYVKLPEGMKTLQVDDRLGTRQVRSDPTFDISWQILGVPFWHVQKAMGTRSDAFVGRQNIHVISCIYTIYIYIHVLCVFQWCNTSGLKYPQIICQMKPISSPRRPGIMVMEFGLLRDRIVGADSRFSGELRGDALENVGKSSKNVSKESKDHSEMCFFFKV